MTSLRLVARRARASVGLLLTIVMLVAATATIIMDLMVQFVRDHQVAAVVATHDPVLVDRADDVVELHDGRRQG
ncbi:hypothetical protein BH23ACT6_BH23ACT6_06460 [soil metagenome]